MKRHVGTIRRALLAAALGIAAATGGVAAAHAITGQAPFSASGAVVALNPQPLPPGEVELNPQPLPPYPGPDIWPDPLPWSV